MGELTRETPKPLLSYKNKSLLQWKLDNMPDSIDEVVIIIGYLGEKIQNVLGNSYKDKKITYVTDREIKGTGMALWQAKDILKESLLVMMGDDIYSKESLENASREKWSITVKKVLRENESSRIEVDEQGKLIGFVTAKKYREKYNNGGLAFTGLYSLNTEIFNYPLVKMQTREEWGLPHTLMQAVPKIDLKILETDFWIPITSEQDLITS